MPNSRWHEELTLFTVSGIVSCQSFKKTWMKYVEGWIPIEFVLLHAGSRCPAGIPDELYYLPPPPAVDCMLQLRGYTDTLPPQLLEQLVDARRCLDVDSESYLDYLCDFRDWAEPTCVDSALKLCFSLFPFLWDFYSINCLHFEDSACFMIFCLLIIR